MWKHITPDWRGNIRSKVDCPLVSFLCEGNTDEESEQGGVHGAYFEWA